VFRRLEFVLHEFEHRGVGKVRDREHRLEYGLQALVGPAADWLPHQQELVVGRLLNLDEVRHLCDFLDFPEKLANALATGKRRPHPTSRLVNRAAPGRLSERPPSIATTRPAVEPPLLCDSADRRTAMSLPPSGRDMGDSGVYSPGIRCVDFTLT